MPDEKQLAGRDGSPVIVLRSPLLVCPCVAQSFWASRSHSRFPSQSRQPGSRARRVKWLSRFRCSVVGCLLDFTSVPVFLMPTVLSVVDPRLASSPGHARAPSTYYQQSCFSMMIGMMSLVRTPYWRHGCHPHSEITVSTIAGAIGEVARMREFKERNSSERCEPGFRYLYVDVPYSVDRCARKI